MTFGNACVWGRRKQQISEGDQEGLERPEEQPDPTWALLSGARSGGKAGWNSRKARGGWRQAEETRGKGPDAEESPCRDWRRPRLFLGRLCSAGFGGPSQAVRGSD